MTRETKVASIPDVRDDNVVEVLRAVKNVLQVREGHLGDPLDQNVTIRDLTDLELVVQGGVTSLTGGTRVPVVNPVVNNDGYNPTTDLTPPPSATGLVATGGFSNVYLSWNGAPYRNHAYTEIWRATTNVLGNAVRVGTTVSNVYADPAEEGRTYYYWIRFVSLADVTGAYNSTDGTQATTATNPATLLTLLTGQISASQLTTSLGSRIDLIDAPSTTTGSVNARISVVQSQVNDLLNTPAYNNSTTYAADAQVTYNGSLYRAIQATLGNLPTNTSYWEKIGEYASLGDAVAAHTIQINNLETGLGTEVSDRQLLATQLRGNYTGTDLSQVTSGLIYSERVARTSAVDAVSSTVSSLSATVTNNYNTLNAAISTEQTTRANADSALTTSINTLSSTVNSNYSTLNSAIQTEQTARTTADTTLANSIYTLQSTASGLEIGVSWNFDSTTESFVAQGATISWDSSGALRINSSSIDPFVRTPNVSFDGNKNYLVRMRVKRLAGSGWDGKIYYNTSGHGESETYMKQVADGTITNEWRILEWDMSSLSDWTSSTIINFRIDLGSTASDQFLIDWISVGRVAPQSYATNATLVNDYYTKTAADSAIASATQNLVSNTQLTNTLGSYVTNASLTTNYYTKTATDTAISTATQNLVSTASLNTTLNSYVTTATLNTYYYTKTGTDNAISSATNTLSASIAGTYATSISVQQNYFAKADGQQLQGQYTVKIDYNGYVTGFGLATTAVDGSPTSSFIVRSDSFAIGSPTGPGVVTPTYPFIVRTSATTINGESVPAGVYISDAFIQNGTITTAKIASLTADKITTGNLTATISVNTGMIYGGVNPNGSTPGSAEFGTGYMLGAYGGANQFFIGSPSQYLIWNGSSLNVKGIINATAGYIGQNIIDANGISSPNYVSGSAGWSVNKDGGAEFNNVTVRGSVIAGTNPAIDPANNTLMTGSGVRLYNDGRVVMGNSTANVVWNNSALYINGMTLAKTASYTPGFLNLLNLPYVTSGGRVSGDLLVFTVQKGGQVVLGATFNTYARYDPQVWVKMLFAYVAFYLYKDGVETGPVWNLYRYYQARTDWRTDGGMTAQVTLSPGTYRLKVFSDGDASGRWYDLDGTFWRYSDSSSGDIAWFDDLRLWVYQAAV